MRTVSFDNMINNNIEDFSITSKGDIMNKNLADIKDSAEGVRKILTEIYDTIILLLGYFVSMLIMDYKITLIVTIFFILSMLVANLIKFKIYKKTSEYKKEYSKAKDVTLNSLKNEIYYRGFGASDIYYKNFEEAQNKLEKKSIKSMIFKDSMTPIYQAIALLGIFFVVYFSAKNVMNSVWKIGTFSAYLSTYVLVATKVSKVGKVFNAYTTFKVSWKRCSPYLKNREDDKEIKFAQKELNLDVKDLTFGYDKSFVLHDISFNLNKGEALGICGMIHSGKSTLGGALSGLYDYEGSIKLQGIELKDVRKYDGKGIISYAPSQTEIFNDTLRYNIAFEDKDVSNELAVSMLNEDINSFANKEDEVLSHSNSNLSGGQLKRLQIARGVYDKPKLIIMDDPFNAIDIDMSQKITDNIKNYCSDSILVLINNQKEILQKMDKIIFLKHGSYLYGTYQELLKDKDFNELVGGNK